MENISTINSDEIPDWIVDCMVTHVTCNTNTAITNTLHIDVVAVNCGISIPSHDIVERIGEAVASPCACVLLHRSGSLDIFECFLPLGNYRLKDRAVVLDFGIVDCLH